MKVELNNYQKEVIERIEKLMGTDYERKGNYIPLDSFISIIEDLEYQVHSLEEKVEDTESYYQDNYEPVSPYKMYGVAESEFH